MEVKLEGKLRKVEQNFSVGGWVLELPFVQLLQVTYLSIFSALVIESKDGSEHGCG